MPWASKTSAGRCCCNTTPGCAETIVNVWDKMNPGQQAQGVLVSIDWVQVPFYNPAFPYKQNFAIGAPGTNFGVLPPQSYWGYSGAYVPTFLDSDNDNNPIFFNNNGQIFTMARCASLHMAFCKVTIDVDTEEGAVCEAYAPDRQTSWGQWVRPNRNVTYSLSQSTATGPTTVSDPINPRPVRVIVSAGKECTLGNCKEIFVERCGQDLSVALPLFHHCGLYYPPPNAMAVDCTDKGCLVRGPGPNYAGVLYKSITVVFTPYVYTNIDPMTGETFNDPNPPYDARPRWLPDKFILGNDWGVPFTINYVSPGVWDSGCIGGGNGRPAYQSSIPYAVYYQSKRIVYTINGLVYTAYTSANCDGGFTGTHQYGAPDCAPTDIEIVNTVSGMGGGTYVWFKAYE